MQEAGVPTLPAIEIQKDTDIKASAAEKAIQCSLKLQPVEAEGACVVESEKDLDSAVEGAKREAATPSETTPFSWRNGWTCPDTLRFKF